MTLVAGISIGGAPAFVGDLLTSWGLPKKLELPTRPDLEIHEGVDGNFAAGLAQKIVIVRPYLMIAWAGSLDVIHKLVNQLDKVLPRLVKDFPGHEDDLFAPLDSLPNTVEVVALFFDGSAIHPFCVHTRGFELEKQRIYLLGSGRESFFKFAQETTEVLPDIETPDGLAARAIMMRFAANAMMSQYASKMGLSESWGGGFEVAYTTAKGFKKVDNILVRCWSLNPDGELGNIGVSFLIHYRGTSLKLTSFGERVRTTTVRSLIDRFRETPLRKEIIPEWTVDLFYRASDSTFFSAVQLEKRWSKGHAVFSFDGDELVGWKMDRVRLDRIIEMTKYIDKPGFTLTGV